MSVTSELASKLNPSDVLYVIAIPFTQTETLPSKPESTPLQTKKLPLQPIAVIKIAPVRLPASYDLSEKDVLFPDKKFEGPFTLIAKIKRGGKPSISEKGDLEGVYQKGSVSLGMKNVDIVIDREE